MPLRSGIKQVNGEEEPNVLTLSIKALVPPIAYKENLSEKKITSFREKKCFYMLGGKLEQIHIKKNVSVLGENICDKFTLKIFSLPNTDKFT